MGTKQFMVAGFLLAGVLGGKAQTTITLQSGVTPTGSTSIGGGNSIRIGSGSGNAFTTGNSAATYNNTFIGTNAGMSNGEGTDNVFVGWGAGASNNGTKAFYNTFIGRSAGDSNNSGGYNTFLGGLAGAKNTSGPGNTFLGFGAGGSNQTGGNNVVVGWGAGPTTAGPVVNYWGNAIMGSRAGNAMTGNANVLIGEAAGFKAGSGNVMIGSNAGYSEAGDNKLYIANTNTAAPLVWGDFSASQLKLNGKVGVGTVGAFPVTVGSANVSSYKLFVTGGILADEVRVSLSSSGTWADYVFANDYKLKPLCEVEAFIVENQHLPNVPSAKEVKENGIDLADMARIQQEKIEELTLYLIQQQKRIDALEARLGNK